MTDERDNEISGDKPQRRRRRNRGAVRGVRVRSAAALTILVIWGGLVLWDALNARYALPEGLNTIALAAATYLFGSAFLKENK